MGMEEKKRKEKKRKEKTNKKNFDRKRSGEREWQNEEKIIKMLIYFSSDHWIISIDEEGGGCEDRRGKDKRKEKRKKNQESERRNADHWVIGIEDGNCEDGDGGKHARLNMEPVVASKYSWPLKPQKKEKAAWVKEMAMFL